MSLQNHYENLLKQDLNALSLKHPNLSGDIEAFKSEALTAIENYKEYGVYLAFDEIQVEGNSIKYTLILNPTDEKSKYLINRLVNEYDFAVPVKVGAK